MLAPLLLLLKRHVDASSVSVWWRIGCLPPPPKQSNSGFYHCEKGDGIKYFHGYNKVEVLRELCKYIPTLNCE